MTNVLFHGQIIISSSSFSIRKTKTSRGWSVFLRVSQFRYVFFFLAFFWKNKKFDSKFPKIREWKEKYDLEDNEEDDTLTYHYRQKYVFRPDLSGPGITGDETVVMVHPGMCKQLKMYENNVKEKFIEM